MQKRQAIRISQVAGGRQEGWKEGRKEECRLVRRHDVPGILERSTVLEYRSQGGTLAFPAAGGVYTDAHAFTFPDGASSLSPHLSLSLSRSVFLSSSPPLALEHQC